MSSCFRRLDKTFNGEVDALKGGTKPSGVSSFETGRIAEPADWRPGESDLSELTPAKGKHADSHPVATALHKMVLATTILASARTLTLPQPVAKRSVATRSIGETIALLKDGRADAFASRDTLESLRAEIPSSRIVTGGFQRISASIAVPKGRPAALALVSA